MNVKKFLIPAGIAVLLGSAAFLVLPSLGGKDAEKPASGPITISAVKGSVSVAVEGAAIVEAFQQTTLRAPAAAVLLSVLREGTYVPKDGIVAALDDSVYRNNLSQAELSLGQAELDAEKSELALQRALKDAEDTKVLLAGKAVSPEKLTLAEEAARNAQIARDASLLRVRQARLAADRARQELRGATIRAPFPGTVLKTYAGPGDLLGSNGPVALFGDLSRLRLRAEIDEYDIGRILPGQAVTISGDSVGDTPLRSSVESVSPIAEIVNNISIFTVWAVVPNSEGTLRPGMSADFSILIRSDKGLVVPSKAVSTIRGRSYLEVLENGEIVKKRVEIGADDGVNLAVLSGIDEGAQVVVPGAAPAAASAETGTKSVLPIPVPGAPK